MRDRTSSRLFLSARAVGHACRVGFLLLALALLPACNMVPQSPEQAAQRIAQAQQVIEQADAAIELAQHRKNDLLAVIGYLPEAAAERAVREIERLDAFITATADERQQAVEAARQAAQATSGATDWGQIVGGVGGAVVPFIPPPWNAVAGGVIAIAAALLGHKRGKQRGDENAVAIARSIEEARKENHLLDAELKKSALVLMKNQTDEQIALVDRAQGKLA